MVVITITYIVIITIIIIIIIAIIIKFLLWARAGWLSQKRSLLDPSRLCRCTVLEPRKPQIPKP